MYSPVYDFKFICMMMLKKDRICHFFIQRLKTDLLRSRAVKSEFLCGVLPGTVRSRRMADQQNAHILLTTCIQSDDHTYCDCDRILTNRKTLFEKRIIIRLITLFVLNFGRSSNKRLEE